MILPKNILIFGCDFFPVRKASEINFWNDMVEELAGAFKQVVVLSVNNREVGYEKLSENIHLYNVKPYYIGNDRTWKDPEYTGKRFQKMPLSIIYKTYSFINYLPIFDDIIKKHDIGIIHYMRGFGLLNSRLIKRYPGLLFSITVPTHIDRGFPLHGIYHSIKNMTLKPMDKVIATSAATRDRLVKLGIKKDKLEVVHWSLKDEESVVTPEEVGRFRYKYNIKPDQKVILWAGPLQDAGVSEFFYSLDVAKKVVASRNDFTFIFAFKPDKLLREYNEAVMPADNIRVIETSRKQFFEIRNIADMFLSPLCNKNRTLAPPLTWIEMMRQGKPVITTNIDGVNEIISHAEDGFIADEVNDMVELISEISKSDFQRMGEKAREKIRNEYELVSISLRYLEIWRVAMESKSFQ